MPNETKRKPGKIKTWFQKVKRKFAHTPLSEEGKTRKPLRTKKQEELNEKLLQAVIDNKIEEVKTYLRLGGDVNYKIKEEKEIKKEKKEIRFVENSTLLIIASAFGYIDIVDELIKNRADVNIQNKWGETAVIYAAENGHTDICKILIENEANVNIRAINGYMALILAARFGHTDTCKLLIENGAEVNSQEDDGWTAVMRAAYLGYTDVCKLLVENGADVNIQDKNGKTALMHAAWMRYTDTVRYLLSVSANPLLTDNNGYTAYDWKGEREVKQILKEYMKRWELIGEKNVLLIQQSIRNCEPERVGEIIKGL